jgi:hypothetical protein
MTPSRRLPGISLALLALVALFASTTVRVEVLPLTNSDAHRQAILAAARNREARIRHALEAAGVVLLLTAVWVVVGFGRRSTRR